ncbi:MAG TPA: FtsX-like permease family protein [Candidatus Saccharimonadales bacterium]|nr:FtsX-like permease family protein [Candidatus Saccharimonadales bacterium]
MRFGDYIAIAFRNIRRQKLRSALTIFAVVIGALSVTIMLALVFSAKGFMTKQFEQSGLFQQVVVSPQTDITWNDQGNGANNCQNCVKLNESLIRKIDKLPHVDGVSRNVHPYVFQAIELGNTKLRVQNVESHDVNGIQHSNIVAGREFNSKDGKGLVIITSDYADKFGYKDRYADLIGKEVQLPTQNYFSGEGSDPVKRQQEQQDFFNNHPGADGRDFQPTPTVLSAKIVGITDTLDNSYTLRVPLAWARGLSEDIQYQPAQQQCGFNQPCHQVPAKTTVTDELAKNGYDSLIVKADSATNAKTVASEIKKLGVGATDAQSYINEQLSIFNIIGIVLGGIGGIALAVAAVGVVNTMIMAILERTREIGVMRAVGARRSTVSRLFTFEASLLGFFGGLIGLGIGYVLTLIANPIINKQLASNGLTATNIISLPPWLIIGVIVITTFIGMLAGLYPARRAAHLDPVEALHYE